MHMARGEVEGPVGGGGAHAHRGGGGGGVEGWGE